jgi:hypothetical protein
MFKSAAALTDWTLMMQVQTVMFSNRSARRQHCAGRQSQSLSPQSPPAVSPEATKVCSRGRARVSHLGRGILLGNVQGDTLFIWTSIGERKLTRCSCGFNMIASHESGSEHRNEAPCQSVSSVKRKVPISTLCLTACDYHGA